MPDKSPNPYASPASLPDRVASEKAADSVPRWLNWAAIAFGLTVGGVSRVVRPMIPGPLHYESIVGGLLLVVFAVVVARSYARVDRSLFPTTIAILVLWTAYAVSWSMVARRLWSDLLVAAAMGTGFSLVVALTVRQATRWRSRL